jgi:hypothetical protein
MSHVHRRIAALAFATFAAAAIAAIPALATNTVKIESRVTISDNPPAFHGHVRSQRNACERNRKVKLYKQRRGADRLLGNDETNHRGRWVIAVEPLKSGAYYAKVKRREEGTAGTIYVCRRDTSRTVVID